MRILNLRIGSPEAVRPVDTLLEKFGRILLYVADAAIAKLYVT